jgi:hypothetical protein
VASLNRYSSPVNGPDGIRLARVRRACSIAAAALAASFTVACGGSSPSSTDRAERSTRTIDACRDHGGVAAFDDDSVICDDQTSTDDRARNAVAACREHDGVSAFDDDIVICRDQTFHEAAGG